MTYDPDRPDAHKSRPAPSKPLQWVKVSDYGIKSACERFRIARLILDGVEHVRLFDGHEPVGWYDTGKDARLAAQMIKGP